MYVFFLAFLISSFIVLRNGNICPQLNGVRFSFSSFIVLGKGDKYPQLNGPLIFLLIDLEYYISYLAGGNTAVDRFSNITRRLHELILTVWISYSRSNNLQIQNIIFLYFWVQNLRISLRIFFYFNKRNSIHLIHINM